MSQSVKSHATSMIAWLGALDNNAYNKYLGILERSSSELDPLLHDLINQVEYWRQQWSIMDLQSLLGTLYQGALLRGDISNFNTTFQINGFLPYIQSLDSNYQYSPSYDANIPPAVSNPEITSWINAVKDRTGGDNSRVAALEDSVHKWSSDFTYRSIFRPKSIGAISSVNILNQILESRGYKNTYLVLNTNMEKPDY